MGPSTNRARLPWRDILWHVPFLSLSFATSSMTVLALRDGNAPLRRRCAAESWVMPEDGPSHGGALPRETQRLHNRDGRAPLFRSVTQLFHRFMWRKCVGLARRPFSNFAGTFSFAD
jgi:hypothetical protein